MKFTQLRAFEKHLEGASPNHFSALYVILGKEAFQRKSAAEKLIKALKKGTKEDEFELQTFEADQLSHKQLVNELNAFALFAAKRVIWIENADKLSKDSIGALESYFENPNQDIVLLLTAPSLHQSSNFYKKCEKIGIVVQFQEEKPWEKERSIQDWIASMAQEEGKAIDPACCQHLVKLIGTQQALLSAEIQKLVCFVGSRKQITLQDVTAIVSPIPLDSAWQLGEAIFRRDGASALRICKGLLMDETPFFVLIRQLRSQFQTEFQVCSILSQGGSSAEVTKQFPYMKGSILERHLALAQGYGMQGFKKGLLLIDEAELQAKNSGLDVEFLAELLMVKLTSR